MLISETQILEVLRRQNGWWQTGKVPDDLAPSFKRLAYYQTQSFLRHTALQRAVILTGARRVGKTVILHQIAQQALSEGLSPKRILYVTFEDLTLTQANLREILTLYEQNIEAIGDGTLILLDEIHYTADWSRWLMTIAREYPKARIAATGSAAVLLRDGQQESAAGRWVSVHVPTLSFFEYVRLKGLRPPSLPVVPSVFQLPSMPARTREEILAACRPLEAEFPRYLLQGGFPAFVNNVSLGIAQRLLREDVVDKALKRDMAHLYGARSLAELDQIFVFLCFNSGAVVEKSTLAKELGVSSKLVESHLQRLEDAHLIYRLNPINLEGKKALKPRPKMYVADSSLRNAVLLRGDGLFSNPTELGGVIEACVFKHLYAFFYTEGPQFGYLKLPKSDREIDFVLNFPSGERYAIEVKYQDRPGLGQIHELMTGTHPAKAAVVTKNSADYGPFLEGQVMQIPAHVFTYLLGNIELQRWLQEFPPKPGEAPYGEESDPLAKEAVNELPKTPKN